MFGRKKKEKVVEDKSVKKAQTGNKRVLPFNPLIILFGIIALTALIGFYAGYCIGKGAVVTPAIEEAVLDFSGGPSVGHGTAEDHGYYSEKNDEVGWADTSARKPFDNSSENAMQSESGSFSYSEGHRGGIPAPQGEASPNMQQQGARPIPPTEPQMINGRRVMGVETDKNGLKTYKLEDKEFQQQVAERGRQMGINASNAPSVPRR